MATRKRRPILEAPTFKPPTPEQELEHAADHFARAAVEASPQMKRMKASVRARALKAAKAGRKG